MAKHASFSRGEDGCSPVLKELQPGRFTLHTSCQYTHYRHNTVRWFSHVHGKLLLCRVSTAHVTERCASSLSEAPLVRASTQHPDTSIIMRWMQRYLWLHMQFTWQEL